MSRAPSRMVSFDVAAPIAESADYIDACLLRWLLHYTLQRVEDMALGIRCAEQTVRRHLTTLEQAHLVEHLCFTYTSRTRTHWYHLTNTGIVQAAALEHKEAQAAAQQWMTTERHLLHYIARLPTFQQLQDTINQCVLAAPDTFAYPDGTPAAIRWRWQRSYHVSFQDKHQDVTCQADAVLLLRRSPSCTPAGRPPEQEFYTLWMYADLGKAAGWSRQLITARLRQLLQYRESLARWPYDHSFPLVVALVESELQRERWHQALFDASTRRGMTLVGLVCLLNGEQQMTCQRLGTGAPCSLRDQLRPMPRTALLPGLLPPLPPLDPSAIISLDQHTTVPRLVRGKFQERGEALATRPASVVQERSLAYLLGLDLSQRYRELLLLLYSHPLCSAQDLASFLDLSERSLLRYLWSLAESQCVETVKQEIAGKTELRWKVAPRGLRYVAASQHLPLAQVAQVDEEEQIWQPGVQGLQKQLRHTAGVYRFLATIHQAARTQGDRIVWCESHLACARRYHYQGQWHNFRPDAVVLYEQQTGEKQRWHLWLEWDEATMSREQLDDKLRSYTYYMQSREWRRTGQSAGIPLLLFVTSSRGQAEMFRTLAEELLAGSTLQVYVAVRERLEDKGFLAPIWCQAVPPLPPEQRKLLKKPIPLQ